MTMTALFADPFSCLSACLKLNVGTHRHLLFISSLSCSPVQFSFRTADTTISISTAGVPVFNTFWQAIFFQQSALECRCRLIANSIITSLDRERFSRAILSFTQPWL